jgi:hypothetical protein
LRVLSFGAPVVMLHRMACPHAENCALYSQFSMDALLNYWKSAYCHAEYERCARFKLSSKGEPVAPTLLPSGKLMSSVALSAKKDDNCG